MVRIGTEYALERGPQGMGIVKVLSLDESYRGVRIARCIDNETGRIYPVDAKNLQCFLTLSNAKKERLGLMPPTVRSAGKRELSK